MPRLKDSQTGVLSVDLVLDLRVLRGDQALKCAALKLGFTPFPTVVLPCPELDFLSRSEVSHADVTVKAVPCETVDLELDASAEGFIHSDRQQAFIRFGKGAQNIFICVSDIAAQSHICKRRFTLCEKSFILRLFPVFRKKAREIDINDLFADIIRTDHGKGCRYPECI